MAGQKNTFGLTRAIPEAVKREVRQRCGFGCVVCGSAIYDYEHFDPEFKDARAHDPKGIALLCPNCHRDKGNGLLPEEEYIRRIHSPITFERGFSSRTAWLSQKFAPEILLGNLTFSGGTSVLRIGGKIFLGFEPPEQSETPPRLNYRIHDQRGYEVFSIIGNEIRCHNEAFDIEATGAVWKVRSALYKINSVIRLDPPTRITIERIHFRYLKWELIVDGRQCELVYDGNPAMITMAGMAKVVGPCLYSLAEDEPKVNSKDMKITFGEGPSPLGTIPDENGFTVNWPVYCLANRKSRMPYIMTFHGRQAFPVYIRKDFAEVNCPKDFEPIPLNSEQCRICIEACGLLNQCEVVVFNPDPKRFTTGYEWRDFVETLRSKLPDLKNT